MPEGIQYQIIRADKEGCPAIPDLTFTDPAEAAKVSKQLMREMGEKLMVKAITNDKWRERELARIKDGTYRPLPWAHHDFWGTAMFKTIWKDQFPHPSVEKAGWIAYTKNAEDGMKDKQTIVRPGTYLKYFARPLDHYGISERQLVDMFTDAYGPLEVKFASTEAEIISTYENGPDTCMKAKHWPHDGRNPAWIYANGDLQVAYLGELDHATARTLVWPEKKIYSRVYGDIARLTRGLERLGYKWGAPIGAKLKRVQLNPVKFDPNRGPPVGCFLAPYIDKKNQRGGGHLAVLDKGDHLEICEEGALGSHHCGMADGYSGQYVPRADEMPTFTCDHCGVAGHHNLTTVFTTEDSDEEESWCNACRKRSAYTCGYSGSFFSIDVERIVVEGAYWTKYYANMYAAKCEMTGALVNQANILRMNFADGTAKNVWANWVQGEGGYFRSDISRKNYLKRDRIRVKSADHDGTIILGRGELKYHTFTCDDCGEYSMVNDRMQSPDTDKLLCPDCYRQPGLKLRAKKLKSDTISYQTIGSDWLVAPIQYRPGR